VAVGVGAAFDFLSGHKAEAPEILHRSGLEWVYRLATEPRRLWRRYLVGNVVFVVHALLRLPRSRRSATGR
jgi:N-acetylglucosaminyldiphosphoundecaprenol N-acetyl-beta-D-mannosaminyltransferase